MKSFQCLCVGKVCAAETELARQQDLADALSGPSARPALMLWRCRPALLVTRPDTRLPRFDRAAVEMQAAGWPIVLRKSGGRACPVGPGTLQVSLIEAVSHEMTIRARYAGLASLIQPALRLFQIVAETGCVAAAYCSGEYDLAVGGKKIAGMSQHWFRNRGGVRCVVTAASINVEEAPDVLAGVVNRFYDRAGSALRCNAAAITNVRLCGGGADEADEGDLAVALMNQLVSR